MVQAQTTTIPYNGSGTVNIHINNPSASLAGGMPPYCMPYPVYPCYYYPPNYYLGNMNPNNNITQTTNVNTPAQTQSGQAQQGLGAPVQQNTVQEKQEKQKQHEIVVLTDNYIKNLENYLRSNNTELRQKAVIEVLKRFKEDKSRMENPSLTALLNLALQDTDSVVRATAMSVIQAGYAKGDNQTEALLKQLQQRKDNFSLGASQATDSLLQMSKTKAIVPDNSHEPSKTKEKKGA